MPKNGPSCLECITRLKQDRKKWCAMFHTGTNLFPSRPDDTYSIQSIKDICYKRLECATTISRQVKNELREGDVRVLPILLKF